MAIIFSIKSINLAFEFVISSSTLSKKKTNRSSEFVIISFKSILKKVFSSEFLPLWIISLTSLLDPVFLILAISIQPELSSSILSFSYYKKLENSSIERQLI